MGEKRKSINRYVRGSGRYVKGIGFVWTGYKKPDKPRFDAGYKINSETGCWEWQKCVSKNGYGQITINGKLIGVHVASYLFYVGEIEKGILVCHTCDNKICCNPFHLFAGTHQDNMDDMWQKGRKSMKPHPSIAYYQKGCRCDDCKELANSYNRSLWGEDKKLKQRVYRAKRRLSNSI